MHITKRNHYNPCFWTAFWNADYYNSLEIRVSKKARKQIVYSLNIPGNKIFTTTVENVFWAKELGLARLTDKDILELSNKRGITGFNHYLTTQRNDKSELGIDFENHFTAFDNISREPLERTIRDNNVASIEDKTYIALFILDLVLKHPKNFNKMVKTFESSNRSKFELLFNIKTAYSDTSFLYNMVIPLIEAEWILYRTNKFTFPLGDYSVISEKKHYLIALSPKLLLKINLKKKVKQENICRLKNGIDFFTLREFISKTVKNSDTEIIFTKQNLLLDIMKTNAYKSKHKKEYQSSRRPVSC